MLLSSNVAGEMVKSKTMLRGKFNSFQSWMMRMAVMVMVMVVMVMVMVPMMIVARVQGPRPILLLHNSAFSPHFTPLVHDDHDD